MSLLSGILGSQINMRASADNSEFAQAEGDQALAGIINTSNAIDMGMDRLDRLMGAAITISALNPTSEDGVKMARIHLAEAMTACELPEDDAIDATAGLESEGIDVGLEAWSSIKDFVKSIIDWVLKQWKKIKRFVLKYWNKYFGDVERLKNSWTKVLEEAKTKQTGYTLEKKAKGDFEKTADWFCTQALGATTSTKLKGEALAASLENYNAFAENYIKVIESLEDRECDESTILTDEGTLTATYAAAPSGSLVENKNDLKIVAIDETVKGNLTKAKGAVAGVLNAQFVMDAGCGRIVIAACLDTSKTTADTWPDYIKSDRFYIGDVVKDQKKEKKVTLDFIEASEIEELADKHIELLDNVIALKRNKKLEKIEDKLEKETKSLEKWKKNVPEKDSDTGDRATFRQGVKIATEEFARMRRYAITTPLEFAQQMRTLSGAHLEFAQRSLKAHKKD